MNKKYVSIVLVVIFVIACENNTESSDEKTPAVASTTELGVVGAPSSVTARDGGSSVQMGNKILWTFGDTIFNPAAEDGSNGRSNTAAMAPLSNPLNTSEPTDANGAPYRAVPFTTEEVNYNNGNEARIALWPGGLISTDDGSALAFVHKLYVKSGNLNYENIGVVTARFSAGQTTATRTGRLFNNSEPIFVSPLKHQAFTYLYGMIKINGSQGVGVARAPSGKELNSNSYEAWDGSGWTADLSSTATIFSGVPGAVSVSWNEYLGKYTAVHSKALSNRVVMRTADRP